MSCRPELEPIASVALVPSTVSACLLCASLSHVDAWLALLFTLVLVPFCACAPLNPLRSAASQTAVARVRSNGLRAADSNSDSGDGTSSDGEGDTSDAALARRLADVRAEVDVLLEVVARRRRRRRRRRSERAPLDAASASPDGPNGVNGGDGGGGSGGGGADFGGAIGGSAAQVTGLSDAAGSGDRLNALSSTAAADPDADTHTTLFPTAQRIARADGSAEAELSAAPVTWRAADGGSAMSNGAAEETAGIGGAEGETAGSVGADGGTSGRGGPVLDASGDEDDFMSMDPPDVSVFKHAAW